MRKIKPTPVSTFRFIAVVIAFAAFLSTISYFAAMAISDSIRIKQSSIMAGLRDDIQRRLEFSGLNDEVKALSEEFTNLFSGCSNVIITDNECNIVYKVNDGYLSEENRFTVAVDPRETIPGTVYLLDGSKRISYVFRLYEAKSGNNLRALGTGSNISEILFPGNEGVSLESENSDRSLSSVLEMKNRKMQLYEKYFTGPAGLVPSYHMDYSYIGSKGYNLFFTYDTNNIDNSVKKQIGSWDRISEVSGNLAAAFFILYWLMLPIWVFADANRIGANPALWAILVLAANLIGLIVYLAVRPEAVLCKTCGSRLNKRFIACPHCGTQSRSTCVSCRQILDDDWVICPYCGNKKGKSDPDLAGVNL